MDPVASNHRSDPAARFHDGIGDGGHVFFGVEALADE